MAIYGQRFINGSVEWLVIPAPFCVTGFAWTDNLLVPKARWGYGIRVGDWDWGTRPGVLIGADVPWRGVVPDRTAYLPRSPPENTCTTVRHVREARLLENHLVRAQYFLYAHHVGSDERVNRSNDKWYGL